MSFFILKKMLKRLQNITPNIIICIALPPPTINLPSPGAGVRAVAG